MSSPSSGTYWLITAPQSSILLANNSDSRSNSGSLGRARRAFDNRSLTARHGVRMPRSDCFSRLALSSAASRSPFFKLSNWVILAIDSGICRSSASFRAWVNS